VPPETGIYLLLISTQDSTDLDAYSELLGFTVPLAAPRVRLAIHFWVAATS